MATERGLPTPQSGTVGNDVAVLIDELAPVSRVAPVHLSVWTFQAICAALGHWRVGGT
jgi:hypothetical protein